MMNDWLFGLFSKLVGSLIYGIFLVQEQAIHRRYSFRRKTKTLLINKGLVGDKGATKNLWTCSYLYLKG